MKIETAKYEFAHNSSYTRGFTWAASIIPRSEVVRRVCPECRAMESHPEGAFDVIVEGGTKYPDVLGCGAYPFLIVSRRVIDAWFGSGITSFHTFPVGIAKIRSKKLMDVVPPSYFRVEIDGRCRIDLADSGLRVVRSCPKCHHLWTDPMVPSGFQMVPSSWDGSALFRDEVLYPRVSFCTEAVLTLAREYKLTNFRFEPMEGPFDSSSKGIDYMKGKQ